MEAVLTLASSAHTPEWQADHNEWLQDAVSTCAISWRTEWATAAMAGET